ncbi:ATP/GTP-binding protein [Candidatus Bathyarchaeota archaeon]|nr:ATP/GTP-binding protein [Candidatus Bathyarchaeota archaeon]
MYVLFVGMAGSGKSSLTASFAEWMMEAMGATVGCVNLDPGCTYVPFKPDFDIRKLFTIGEIMESERLGPNGAMIRAAELMEKHLEEILNALSSLKAEHVLLDTPGQMEMFVFREAAPRIVEALGSIGRPIVVYVLDASLARRATDLIVASTLMVATQLRLGIPTITVLNKVDMLSEVALKKIETLISNPKAMEKAIIEEGLGAMTDLALGLWGIHGKVWKASSLILPVSAKTGYGMEALYDLCHEAFCVCGEL